MEKCQAKLNVSILWQTFSVFILAARIVRSSFKSKRKIKWEQNWDIATLCALFTLTWTCEFYFIFETDFRFILLFFMWWGTRSSEKRLIDRLATKNGEKQMKNVSQGDDTLKISAENSMLLIGQNPWEASNDDVNSNNKFVGFRRKLFDLTLTFLTNFNQLSHFVETLGVFVFIQKFP